MAVHHITELSDNALTDELDLEAFLAVEYANHAKKPNIRTLRKRAAAGKIPGARKDGKPWIVNMVIYRRFKRRRIEESLVYDNSNADKSSDSPAERVTAALRAVRS